jgi:ssDNA-binding Zn-finger/Zn-ribbon topoisomerase 1
MDKGKLRKTTGKICPDCGHHGIQIREVKERLYMVCNFCEYQEPIQGKVRIREKEEEDAG